MLILDRMKIGRNLKQVREDRLMTQAELAHAAGLGVASVVRIENDHTEPRFSTIKKLAKALDVDARELVKGARGGDGD